jgi:hypothetical protein
MLKNLPMPLMIMRSGDGILTLPVAAVVGFEQEEYTVYEDDLFLEVCMVLQQPSSLDDVLVFISLQTINDTAEG